MNGDVTAWSRRKAQVGGPFTTLARISVSDVWHEFPTVVYGLDFGQAVINPGKLVKHTKH